MKMQKIGLDKIFLSTIIIFGFNSCQVNNSDESNEEVVNAEMIKDTFPDLRYKEQNLIRDTVLFFGGSEIIEWNLQLSDTILHGLAVRYWKNSVVRDSISFVNGAKSGIHKKFRKNGERFSDALFLDGCKQSESIYANNTIKTKYFYSDTQMYMTVVYINGITVDTGYTQRKGPVPCEDQIYLSKIVAN